MLLKYTVTHVFIQCYATFLTPSSTEPLTHLVLIEIFSAKPEPTNPNSVTMKLEVALGFDSEDINVERESGGESADKEIRDDEKHLCSSSHFQQSFTLGPGADKLTANLAMVF